MVRIPAIFTNTRNGKTTRVFLSEPRVLGGIWTLTERTRRAAFKRIGADWEDSNAGVTSDITARAVDANGHHTFTVYTPPPMAPFTFNEWHAWTGTGGRILLSDQAASELRDFDDVDGAINWLYQAGHKEAARALNNHAKGPKA